MKTLRIALIAPPWFPIPPKGYGGIELVVHLLYRGLVELGHDVVLFGSEESEDKVEFIDTSFLKGDLNSLDRHVRWDRHFVYSWQVMKKLEELNSKKPFDIIHDNTRPPGLFFYRLADLTSNLVHTVHESVKEPRILTLKQFDDSVKFVALSKKHKKTLNGLDISKVIYNAIDDDGLYFKEEPLEYMIQIARINPDKGQHLSIELAKATNTKLIIAGKVDPIAAAQKYFKEKIEPEIGKLVEYIPEVTGDTKYKLISEAYAGIYPVVYDEPFGLAIAESLAAGVPVITSTNGAMPELVENGRDGFVCLNLDEMIAALDRISKLSRKDIYNRNSTRFSYKNMTLEYLNLYYSLVC